MEIQNVIKKNYLTSPGLGRFNWGIEIAPSIVSLSTELDLAYFFKYFGGIEDSEVCASLSIEQKKIYIKKCKFLHNYVSQILNVLKKMISGRSNKY